MSIYLPFGTALFQANGMQLLSISDQQRKLLQGDRSSIRELRRARRGILGVWSRWRALSTLQRTYVCIATGMLFQVRYPVPSIPVCDPNTLSRWWLQLPSMVRTESCKGTGVKLPRQLDKLCVGKVLNGSFTCRSGGNSSTDVPRIPSAMWQLFWSCLYGPYLLYKLRNVRDTHHWRLQTMLCVISG